MATRHFQPRMLRLRKEQWTFLLMALLCVSVIVGTALWTRQAEFARVTPTPPVSGDVSVAHLLQQSLSSAQTATPAPTTTPADRIIVSPCAAMTLLRPFDDTRMRQSAIGLWALHDAADYACADGAKISAMADGTVVRCAESGMLGAFVEIDHGGVLVCYANLSMLCDIRAGDPVRAGQALGFVGSSTMPEERDLPPHLHLRILAGGLAIDPENVLQSGVFPSP